ncbi:MAG: glycoside hydrolase family 9 protein [Flavobacteriales bacterium]|nr:glycoside hydrolase family 9 protein [Flavobacteriales bacterium]MCB9447824.1 glycoside hydrolase family 9 protein [Flavobacteriales bacterium]
MNKKLRSVVVLLIGLMPGASAQYTVQKYICVDQFGYRPQDDKVAVLVDPQQGANASDSYQPGGTLELRRLSDGSVVYSGAPTAWNGGATQAQSGDKGWWFDFSSVKDTGTFYVYDPSNAVGSYPFDIFPDVYFKVLRAATRVYFYQRCGQDKQVPSADSSWTDAASYMGPGQDTEAHDVDDKNNASKVLDLHGGWYDAGDNNKYITFLENVLHQLLDAYAFQPGIWTDDFGIPESGNGLPDLLDEVMWELDWMKRMQDTTDGGVHIKMGDIDFNSPSPPSSDTGPRYYGPKCSSSTIVAAGIFAHAAEVLSAFPSLTGYADDLRARAELAWTWYSQNPRSADCDSQEIKAGDADKSLSDQDQGAVAAAAYLFGATGKATYSMYVKNHYTEVTLLNWWGPYGTTYGDALLYYAGLPSADVTVAGDVLSKKTGNANGVTDFYGFADQKDLYRSYMPDAQYHWGSNQVKAATGIINLDMNLYGLDQADSLQYAKRALASLHYMHGVNPMQMVYLSNMGALGAENSVNTIYHSWFNDGTPWDDVRTSSYGPAPGYVPGGPNKDYGGSLAWLGSEPVQKSYYEWNTGYPENSWEITEPGIYYQSAYIRLLASFTQLPPKDCNGETGGKAFIDSCGTCAGGGTGITPVTDPDLCSTGVYEGRQVGEVTVYPSPAHEHLYVAVPVQSRYTYQVVDALGQTVLRGEIFGAMHYELSLARFKAGFYLLTLSDHGYSYHVRFVVNR